MRASLKEFLLYGSFGLIELGSSKCQVEQHIGPPDEWHVDAQNYQASAIWKYGDVEFYFQEDALYMIFMDDFSMPGGGVKIELDAWAIASNLTCSLAEQLLSTADIAYRKEAFPYNDNGVQLITSIGTVLSFCGEDAATTTLHCIYRRVDPA